MILCVAVIIVCVVLFVVCYFFFRVVCCVLCSVCRGGLILLRDVCFRWYVFVVSC